MTHMIFANGYDYHENQDGSCYAVNSKTGEVTDALYALMPAGSYITTPEYSAASRERRRQRQHFFDLTNAKNKLGKFYFLATNNGMEQLNPATAMRLIYLGSYLRYDTDSLYITQRKPMKIPDLQKVMGLSDATIRRFLDEVIPTYLFTDKNGNLHLNSSIFRRGPLPENGEQGSFQKVYFNAIRSLYRAIPIRKHKQIGYIFQLLSHINIQYNMLCQNPYETDIQHVEPLTMREFCGLIGHSYSTVARLIDTYSNVHIMINKEEKAFCSFVSEDGSLDNARIFINPHVFYSGTDPERANALGHFCQTS